MRGHLYMIVGPMRAGKSTELKITASSKGSVVYTHSIDTRVQGGVRLHTGETMPARKVPRAHEISPGPDVRTVCIDEGQFFDPKELRDAVAGLLAQGVDVWLAGLDFDSEKRPFQFVALLQPLATWVKRKTARCQVCNAAAEFTRCGVAKGDGFLVDKGGVYESVCASHWHPAPSVH